MSDEPVFWSPEVSMERVAENLRAQLAAKDAEIAELRKRVAIFQRGEALALGQMGTATIERDEARECVGRLCGVLRDIRSVDTRPAPLITHYIEQALAATPEHLR